MRNTRAVYQKLRDIKFLYLTKLYKKYLKKIPESCKYNYPYKIEADKFIRLCLLHQPELDLKKGVYPHLIEVCEDINHCSNCNAFTLKYTKEDLKKVLLEELNDPKLKEKKYPEICALEWVLEQTPTEIPHETIYQKLWCILKEIFSKRLF